MEYTSCHPLLQYTKEEMIDHRKQLGMSNLQQLRTDIDSIEDWFDKQPHLAGAGIDRDVIERMMLQAKGSIERTKERIERLYILKASTPELIAHRDTHSDDIDSYWTWSRHIPLPKLFAGKRITIIQIKSDTSNTFEFNKLFRIGFMFGDLRLKNDYSNGDIYFIDFANTNLIHLAKVNPYIMRKAETMFQEGYGVRISAIHVLNAPSFADRLLFLIKQAFKPKITDRIMIHSSLEEFHKHVPKEHLPSDYGGSGKSLAELGDIWRRELRTDTTRQFLLDSERRVADERLRMKMTFAGGAEEQLSGSFRKLELD